MASVDDKVVSIQFDNKAFQARLTETIDSLGRLNKTLQMAGATKGLTDLSAAAKNVNVDPLGVSVEGVSAKFLALSGVAFSVLDNIVTKVISVGAQFANSLTLAPIAQGFGEFELKMGSIQTIMSGSGESLEVVNQKLQELNAYSDKTIYSFKDMTSNIGKFTNAGVSLDASVASIQGVANVAALSGANAEEASRAMYNFAQSLSSGSVKLMDWKSIELANMATVEFKQELINSAVALGTLTKSGDGWKTAAGNMVTPTKGFNESLSDAWLSFEALTETLGRYSDASTDIGARATAAAQDVKTFSQMIDTMKESVGSGWATTFENIFGNFEEGKELWTGINNAFSGFIGGMADARNATLLTWKTFDGFGDGMSARQVAIDSFAKVFKFLGDLIRPIGDAFREIFPKTTGADLIILTARFADFADGLKVGGDTAEKIKAAFKGFFAILSIGWEIFKGVTRVLFTLAKGLWQIFSPLLNLVAGAGSLISGFHAVAVEGEGISSFFDGFIKLLESVIDTIVGVVSGFVDLVAGLGLIEKIGNAFERPIAALKEATEAVKDFFGSLSFGKGAAKGAEETGKGLEKTAGLFDRLLSALGNVLGQIGDVFADLGGFIADAFSGLGGAIADALGSGDFSQVLNIIKTGLLGGILAMLVKFFKNGLKFDFGQGAIFAKLGEVLDTVTSGLKSLQANVRADTLLKIAGAMALLAVAIIGLSLVDAAALGKAMAAITAGFVQLTTVMLMLEKAQGPASAARIAAMSAGIVALAAAMILLSLAMKIIGTMEWGELAKGLAGVTVGLLVMSKGVQIIGNAKSLAGVVRAGIAMILIAGALIVLAYAMKKFAEMDLMEMGMGLLSASIGIGVLIMALKKMPDDIAKKGLGLLILALSLRSLAKVVELFAGIPTMVLAKGFVAIAGGLYLIGKAMDTFPDDMPQKAVALVLLSGAMYLMGMAIEKVGSIPFGSLVKGVGGLAVMLGVLAIAILAMDEAKGGVLGLIAAAAGLLIMAEAIEQVGKLPLGDVIQGVLALAALLAILALASVVAPGIALLGAGLLLVGAGLALIGVGVALAGKGFELMAKFGSAAMGTITAALQEMIRQLPQFISAFVEGLIQAAVEVADAFPQLVESIKKVLVSILDAVQEIAPELGDTLTVLLNTGLQTIIDSVPGFFEAGFAILTGFLQGIRDNMGQIVMLVMEIIQEFLNSMAAEMPAMRESVVNFIATMLTEAAYGLGQLMPTLMIGVGRSFIQGFWDGITQELGKLGELISQIVSDVIRWITTGFGIFSPSRVMLDIGKNVMQGFINGISSLLGIVTRFFRELPGKVLGAIGSVLTLLKTKGEEVIRGLMNGIALKFLEVKNWFGRVGTEIKNKITGAASWLLETGKDIIRGLWDGILAMKDWLGDKLGQVGGWVTTPINAVLDILSPSRVMMETGRYVGEGLIIGIDNMRRPVTQAAERLGYSVSDGVETNLRDGLSIAAKTITEALANSDDFNPTITPVLDLSKVQAASRNIGAMMKTSDLSPEVSLANARYISAAAQADQDDLTGVAPVGPTEVKFEQNIYAPKELSTNDIYRNTKSQIVLAKEELGI